MKGRWFMRRRRRAAARAISSAADAPLHHRGAQCAPVTMAAKPSVKPSAQSSSGQSMPTYMVGAPVRVMLAGWCSVFHQSTLNLMIGRFDHADQRQDRAGAVAALRVVEGAHQRDVAEIEEEQHQHRGQPRVPHPPGAPHRLAPQAAGGEAERGEGGADRPDLHGREVGQRMAPDERERREQSASAA